MVVDETLHGEPTRSWCLSLRKRTQKDQINQLKIRESQPTKSYRDPCHNRSNIVAPIMCDLNKSDTNINFKADIHRPSFLFAKISIVVLFLIFNVIYWGIIYRNYFSGAFKTNDETYNKDDFPEKIST